MIAFNLGLAMGTERTAFRKGNFFGYPVNDDVKKAADNDADNKDIKIKDEVDECDHKNRYPF
jgi:hypothetical protein